MRDDFDSSRRTVSGISITDRGHGPTTLFVHGVFTSGRLWDRAIERLLDQRRCITVDLPAHGRTPPVGEPTVWGLADAVSSVIDDLDLDEIHLVGNDTGGAVCQVLLARWPDKFASAALTNCDTEENFPPPMFKPAVLAARARLLALGPLLVRYPRLGRQLYRLGYQDVSNVPDQRVVDFLTPALLNRAGREYMTELLSSMTPHTLAPVHGALSRLDVHTTVIWGTGDVFFERKWADWLVDLIPSATNILEIPGGRLFFPDERADEFVAALEQHWHDNPRGAVPR